MNEQTNSIFLQGEIITEPMISYIRDAETFYEFTLKTTRYSGKFDTVLVIVPERIYEKIQGETFITVSGEIRTRNNKDENGKTHLVVYVFAKDGYLNKDKEQEDEVSITGYICKKPIFRTTPKNRDICDLLLAVNRPSGKRSDYIPSIVWGRDAAFAGELEVGDMVTVSGRLQSREYNKTKEDGTVEVRVAQELSINHIEKLQGEA